MKQIEIRLVDSNKWESPSINRYTISDKNKITTELVDSMIAKQEVKTERLLGKLATVVNVVLTNGMLLHESSACVDESNYDESVGADICIEKIRDKIWFGLGFMLSCSMTNLAIEKEEKTIPKVSDIEGLSYPTGNPMEPK